MPTKHIHRIPLAEEFIEPIGEAVCVCQYLHDGLHCIGRRLSPTFYGHNEGKSSGTLLRNLKTLVEGAEIDALLRTELLELCGDAKTNFQRRNAIVHSNGYTTTEGTQSRAYRRKPSAAYWFLDPQQIRDFTKDVAKTAAKANALLHDPRILNSSGLVGESRPEVCRTAQKMGD